MSNRKVIWEGKYQEVHQSRLVLEDGSIYEEYTYPGVAVCVFTLSNFLDYWEKNLCSGPPLPEEVKIQIALEEIKR